MTLEKILYVEDDDIIAEIVKMTLEDLGGFEVQHRSSGPEGLAAIPTFQPQLILLDVMMPGMDGLETLKHIQRMPQYKQIPVIFITAKAQAHEQQKYVDEGALGVIVKPFDPSTLCDRVQSMYDSVMPVP